MIVTTIMYPKLKESLKFAEIICKVDRQKWNVQAA